MLLVMKSISLKMCLPLVTQAQVSFLYQLLHHLNAMLLFPEEHKCLDCLDMTNI